MNVHNATFSSPNFHEVRKSGEKYIQEQNFDLYGHITSKNEEEMKA